MIDLSKRLTEPSGVAPMHDASLPNIRPKPMKTLSTMPCLNYAESVAFERFRSQTVIEMAGVRSSGFWQNVVLPACYSEPAILNASMALSNASRWLRNPCGIASEDTARFDTVNYYNKAIQYLKAHVTTPGNQSSLRIALITCLVFIALELSSRRFHEATMHLNEGRKLLQSSPHLAASTSGNLKVKNSDLVFTTNPQSIDDELLAVFVDLDLQSTWFGSLRPQLKLSPQKQTESVHPQAPFSEDLPSEFISIQEANRSFVLLTNKCLQFVGQKLEPELHSLSNRLRNQKRQFLYTRLGSWRKIYDQFCANTTDIEKSEQAWKQQSGLMLIQHAWLSVVVPTSYFEVEETDYDSYLPEFMTIIELASNVLPEEGLPWGHFSLEFGLVPPLSWTVLKCRHPQVRRRALSLLTRAGREGLWEPRLPAILGRNCVLLEEAIEDLDSGSLFYGQSSSGQREDWRHMVPLQNRIAIALMHFENEEYSSLRMTFKRKLWDSEGNYMGMEDIIRREPYDVLQSSM